MAGKIDERWKVVGRIIEQLSIMYGEVNVIVAGGAIRDFHNDKPIKDFDIIVYGHPDLHYVNSFVIRTEEDLIFFEKAGSDEYANEDLEVWKSLTGDYDIMFVNKWPINYVKEKFDINICECWWSPAGGFGQTQAYIDGIRRKEIHYVATETDHIDRVRAKYPDFSFFSVVFKYPLKIIIGGKR